MKCAELRHHRGLEKAMKRAGARRLSMSTPRYPPTTKVVNDLLNQRRAGRMREIRLIAALKRVSALPDLDTLTEHAMRKDITSVGRRLTQLSMKGDILGIEKTVALNLATNIITNLTRENKGFNHNPTTKAFACVIRASAGQALYNLVAKNLGLPHERYARKLNANADVWSASLTEADFKVLAHMLKGVMEKLGLELGSVPCMVAEDETGVNAKPGWDPKRDVIIGYDGTLCAAKCSLISKCRKHGCDDPHECDNSGLYTIPMNTSFEEMLEAVKNSRVSSLARAIVLNPLDPRLPHVTLMFTGTCKTFSAQDYIIPHPGRPFQEIHRASGWTLDWLRV